MGWFDEQIRQRKLSDDEVFDDSFADIAGAVAGRRFSDALRGDRRAASDAIGAMLGVRRDDGAIVALIPTGLSGYRFFDRRSGRY